MIKIGPAGLGGVKEAIDNLNNYYKLGLKACEIAFTYKIYLNNKQAEEIGKVAKQLNIDLSIHAPYFINLNSVEKEKIEASKKRILDCCERAHYLNAKYIVFHSGYYGKMSKEETYENIKNNIQDIQETIKKNKWNVILAPEIMGKINVFGSMEEILKLVKEIKCGFCIDFAHLLARTNGKMSYDEMCKQIKEFDHVHAHFSGIEYGDKGEKNHKLTHEKEIEKLMNAIKKNNIKDITIINESPNPTGDAVKTLNILSRII
ncbi:MAG: TIM barrel protein [Candidatus Nanoarchaeia archaeon]|nr:TIM barrel protein [Candidatus Nanoarchaeia archaeon]